MAKKEQFGCKKCGGVIEVEIQPWPERLEIRVKAGGRVREQFGKLELLCKKCSKAVASVSIDQS